MAPTLQSALIVRTDGGARKNFVTRLEGAHVPATALCSDAADCAVAEYIFKYSTCFDIHRFNAIFSDGHNAITYDRRSVQSDTDIEE